MRWGMAKWKSKKIKMDEAKESIMEGINIQREMGIKPLEAIGHLYLGELLADGTDREKSIENLRRSEEMFNQMGMDYWVIRAQKLLASL